MMANQSEAFIDAIVDLLSKLAMDIRCSRIQELKQSENAVDRFVGCALQYQLIFQSSDFYQRELARGYVYKLDRVLNNISLNGHTLKEGFLKEVLSEIEMSTPPEFLDECRQKYGVNLLSYGLVP